MSSLDQAFIKAYGEEVARPNPLHLRRKNAEPAAPSAAIGRPHIVVPAPEAVLEAARPAPYEVATPELIPAAALASGAVQTELPSWRRHDEAAISVQEVAIATWPAEQMVSVAPATVAEEPIREELHAVPDVEVQASKPEVIAVLPELASAVMPLSSFTAPPPAEPQAFRAALEVEHFTWPDTCLGLLSRSRSLFDQLADELLSEAAMGRKVIALTSCRAGEGRTSFGLCIARQLAAGGVKTCLVDADFGNPQVASRLGMAVETGWKAVLEESQPLVDVLVESTRDQLTVLPFEYSASTHKGPYSAIKLALTFATLREHFELVLVDTGPLLEGSQSGLHLMHSNSGVDAAVLVRDVRSTPEDQVDQARRLLSSAHIEFTGIAENFVQS